MASEVILPRVDMDMSTGKIAKWLVEPGTQVAKGQPLFEIETDKAAMEIEAPASGTLRTLFDASGEDIPVGATVAWIYAEGEQEPAAAAPAANAAPAGASDGARQAAPPAASAQSPTPSANGQAAAPAAENAAPDSQRFADENRSFDSALPADSRDASGAGTPAGGADGAGNKARATPLARRLAQSKGLDLSALTGSGPRGRIQAADVEAADAAPAPAASAPAAPARASAPPPPPPQPQARREEPRPAPAPAAPPARPAATGGASQALNVVQLRAGSGTPVVLVHGWGADANGWRPFLAGQRQGRPVLAVDLPGHGGSPLGNVASFEDLVDAVEACLAEAIGGPAHVVAHSLGAAVMTAVAARHTLDIGSLLLLAPAGLGPAINGAFFNGYLAATNEASLTPWMHELVADPAAITASFVRATLKAREGTDLVATQRRVAEAVFPDGTQAFSIRGDLAKLAVPVRVVLGGADRIVPSAQAVGLPGLVATHAFPHVGHMPQFEAREAVATILDQMARD